ncbi:MAG: Signal transduction histidine kinase CheA [Myxococcaceae bacterium]|nr:Signal transduction histidine kinase CheA [Myxococcaceae bacterium]
MAEHSGGGGGGRGESAGDKAREEFFSEAQEIVDGLSRDLLALDDVCRRGGSDAELVNDVFRAVHTLKGLSGLFGAAMMSGLSHELENLLDDLRLGRIELTSQVLDLLFQSVELYGRILAAAKGDAPEPAQEVKALLASLGQVAQQKGGGGGSVVAQYELDPGLLGVLTEYEEHRLRTNLQAGLSLYRMRVQFQLATIDSALDDLKAKTRPHGEIITFLPTGEGGDAESVELEILVASRASLGVLRGAVAGPNITVEEVRRRDGAPNPLASIPPPPPDDGGHGTLGGDLYGTSMSPPTTSAGEALLDEINAGGGNATRTSAPPPAPSFPPGPGQPGTYPPGGIPGVSLPAIPGTAYAGGTTSGGSSGAAAGSRELTLRSVTQTVRVDIRKLDHLMNIVGELAIVRGVVARLSERVRLDPDLKEIAPDLHRLHRSFDRHLAQMQNGILEVRMVPLGQVFDKLARIVRQISREHDKQVNLVITGAETEIDKLIVEELSDPLMHMIRNAIDHGIEAKDERMRVGKPPVGTIALNAFQKGNHVVLEIEDDGKGMDPAVIVAAALRRGLVSESEAREMSSKEVLSLVFQPGFTTRDDVTALSGRGVGMDIVKTNISKLGGVVDISSEVGIGTKMTITLPITLAIISVLMLEVAGRTFCMPLASVEEAIVFDDSMIKTFEGREVMTQRGATLPIVRLAKLFQLEGWRPGVWINESAPTPKPPEVRPGRKAKSYCIVATVADRRVGFIVDKLVGQQDIVIKALGKSLKKARGLAGATELGDQRVGLVLDAAALINEVLASSPEGRIAGQLEGPRSPKAVDGGLS